MSNLATPEGTATTTPTPEGGFFRKFINTIKREINDLSYVEIVTAAGDPKTDVNPDAEMVILGMKAEEVRILARTRIELDGDIMVLLPAEKGSDDVKINQEIMAIHKENVQTAVENWNSFMKNMLTALDLLMNITGLSKSQVLTNFNLPVPTATTTSTTATSGSTTTTTTEPPA
jgi:hypothetical protein